MMKLVIEEIKENYEYQKEKIISDTIKKYYNIDQHRILYTQNGKPYIENNKVYFSISNDNNILLIAFDINPIGADIQFYRKIPNYLKKFLLMEDFNDINVINEFSKKEAVIKLIDSKLNCINDIDLTKYKILSYENEKYVISIAQYH